MYVIVTNHMKWHRENLRSDRENTGNLKMKFEWGPCCLEQGSTLSIARLPGAGRSWGGAGEIVHSPARWASRIFIFLGASF